MMQLAILYMRVTSDAVHGIPYKVCMNASIQIIELEFRSCPKFDCLLQVNYLADLEIHSRMIICGDVRECMRASYGIFLEMLQNRWRKLVNGNKCLDVHLETFGICFRYQ